MKKSPQTDLHLQDSRRRDIHPVSGKSVDFYSLVEPNGEQSSTEDEE